MKDWLIYQAGGKGTCGSEGKMLCVGITAMFRATHFTYLFYSCVASTVHKLGLVPEIRILCCNNSLPNMHSVYLLRPAVELSGIAQSRKGTSLELEVNCVCSGKVFQYMFIVELA